MTVPTLADLPTRFQDKIKIDPVTGCWLWQGSIYPNGYAQVSWKNKSQIAHRITYILLIGEYDRTLCLDHLCRCRCCVNPSHLEPVTLKVNIQRGNTGKERKAKTHCPQGHPYNEENTHLYRGSRYCKTCGKECGERRRRKKGQIKRVFRYR